MADSLIQDVSDTAFMVATYRAMETQRPDALFRDPLAGRLAGTHGEKIVANLPRRAFFGQWLLAIRTCVIDEFIEAAVAEGVDAVLNLGAGLDSRPYRMELPRSLAWIEVDCPKIIALKTERLADEEPHCRLQRVALDLADPVKRKQLFVDVAKNSKKVLVLTEGVVPYLTTQDAASLADDLRAEPAFRYWIVDYFSLRARRYRRHMEKKMKMETAPFRFAPEDYFKFFNAHGWRAKDIRYMFEEAKKLKRPLPLPFLFRCWVTIKGLLMARSGEALRKSMAYVLFEPADVSDT